jgi:hypothetical protein
VLLEVGGQDALFDELLGLLHVLLVGDGGEESPLEFFSGRGGP